MPYALAGFGGALVSDFAHGVPCALQFFPPRTWRDVIAECSTKTYPRTNVASALEASGRELGAPEESLASARSLADANTYVVATGQQGGFLGGPLLTLHKALTAVKLARQYEKEAAGAARFVPVFWVAGDDHDFGEIDHAYFLRDDGAATRVAAPLNEAEKGRSASDLFLSKSEESIQALRLELEVFLGCDGAEEVLSLYASASFETAFAKLMLKWLGASGLVVARSSDLRQFSGAMLARNVEDYDIVSRLIQEAGVTMRTCAYEPGFSEKLRSAPHFFMAEKRGALRGSVQVETNEIGERQFRIRGESERVLSQGELLEQIRKSPELFTPSAPLRPVIQQTIFPVVAAVLGPGEMAYWAQLRTVHEHYGAVWPVIVPRASLTLIDAAAEKAIRKLGLSETPLDLFLNKEELVRRATAGGAMAGKIAAHSNAMLSEFDAMRAEIVQAGAGVDPMLEKLREKFAYELARVAEKTGAALDKSGDAKALRAALVSAWVRPKNAPQERTFCCVQFVAKYPNLVDQLLNVIEPDCREHLVVTT